jgi:hypothetical protein
MGLDISMYRKIEFVRAPANEDDEPEWQTEIQIRGNLKGFESRFTGATGIYRYASSASFRAGSYSGYNEWREQLAKLAGYPQRERTDRYEGTRALHAAGAWEADEGPFWELINFADNEGAIGAEVSAKLSHDFIEWRDRAQVFAESLGILTGGYFMENYNDFARAFAMAADGGVVLFH